MKHITSFHEFINEGQNTDSKDVSLFKKFLSELEVYQSNHYGNYDRKHLLDAYNKLSDRIKQSISPPKNLTSKLYRGADGLQNKCAFSFSNKKTVPFFGKYTIPFREIKSFDGLVSTEKVVKLMNAMDLDYDIGDDEGEVIAMNPVWKFGIDLEKYKNLE